LVVSLPAKWARKYGIKKGDEIEMSEQPGFISLSPTSTQKVFKSKEISAPEAGVLLPRLIVRLYEDGYDEIKITNFEAETPQRVKKALIELIGFETVEQRSNYCILRDVAGQIKDEFPALYRRLFLLVKGMLEDSVEAIRNWDYTALEHLEQRDIDVNRLAHYCMRYLAKNVISEHLEAMRKAVIVWSVERIGDECKYLAAEIVKQRAVPEQEIVKQYEKAAKLFDACYRFVFDAKQETATEASRIFEEIRRYGWKNIHLASIVDLSIQLPALALPSVIQKTR
ncbi:MAG: phosphate uptake regulator PhoU, partial [Candidatus Woesearchaeota archaeon]